MFSLSLHKSLKSASFYKSTHHLNFFIPNTALILPDANIRSYSQFQSRNSSPRRGNGIRSQNKKENYNFKGYQSKNPTLSSKIPVDPIKKRYNQAKTQKKKYDDLKKKKVPGIGHTPVRFQLYPIENEAKSDLISVLKRSQNGSVKKSVEMTEIKQSLKNASFDHLGLVTVVSEAAKEYISTRLNSAVYSNGITDSLAPTPIQTLAIPEILNLQNINRKISPLKDAPVLDETTPSKNNPPPPIDSLGIANSVFLAAETGSGKTLAYLLPVISMLKKEESKLIKKSNENSQLISQSPSFYESVEDFNRIVDENVSVSKTSEINHDKDGAALNDNGKSVGPSNIFKDRRPRAVIIVPTRELAYQTTKICKALSHKVKFRTVLVDFNKGLKKVYEDFDNSPVDVVVGTPASLRRAFYKGQILSYSNVQHVVIDEADSLMDEQGHLEDTLQILKQVRISNSFKQSSRPENILFVSATLPKAVLERILYNYPSLTNISTPKLHQINPRIRVNKIDVPKMFQGSKISAIKEVIRNNSSDHRVMVFCNTVFSANELYKKLSDLKYPVSLLVGNLKSLGEKHNNSPGVNKDLPSAKTNIKNRLATLADFNSTDSDQTSLHKSRINSNLESTGLDTDLSDKKILICTDIGSRGIDTLVVDHVIMYDYPTTAINYLHRCGRTGRVGSSGKVTTLVGKNDRRNQQKIDMFVRSGIVVG
ncbi:ATP-dependent RNA helicase mrh4, mitochondrial [Smittium mucronatum]|uniref:ATP-dependent RNA helicase mrh4, mitochondrial n=1 Tax=Smittium mucronatum TaxID=133383 RepID=A0A1R0GYB6_9FUNG|nr:ATP-dependent RNA helicase mrh4, mitochondrial [Smittium mucronatum]OLY81877.1 ATP-dependent RNA helicase mrh4, mitochondrial [Smittium mucronatum]